MQIDVTFTFTFLQLETCPDVQMTINIIGFASEKQPDIKKYH